MPFENTPTGNIQSDGLTITVVATDERKVYGRLEYAVTPVAGEGSKWVHGTRIEWVRPPIRRLRPVPARAGARPNMDGVPL